VVGLERGVWRDTVPDFQSPAMHDELRYAVRGDLFQNMAIEAMTFRHRPDQEALPMRSLGSFLPGTTPYSIVPYQTTHNTGGALMGTDPQTSVVNRYLQSWEVSNVFVQGACAYPQNPGYNPTGTVGALAYWSARAIRQQYLKHPGPLVR
jgi:choline dehydrogenase-like flavoprotein